MTTFYECLISDQLSVVSSSLFIVYLMGREEELKIQGWEKRFTMDESRLSEMAEQYRELGFEVLIEPVDLTSEECIDCMANDSKRYKTLYTRKN